jgi:hypothetical protein
VMLTVAVRPESSFWERSARRRPLVKRHCVAAA